MPYEFIHGDVWFGGRYVCGPSGRIGVAFDAAEGVLHKHGAADGVSSWADDARRKFRDTGFEEIADALIVVDFPPTPETLEELNACVEITGRVARLPERLRKIGETMLAPAKSL